MRKRRAGVIAPRRLNIPHLETIPDLGVSEQAARLIRLAVWLEQAVHEIDVFLEGIDLKGAGCENYHDDLGGLAFDVWIAALTNIVGPDKTAKAMIKSRLEQQAASKARCAAIKAAHEGGGADGTK